jgi:oligopeptide transport system substrate-binding protein
LFAVLLVLPRRAVPLGVAMASVILGSACVRKESPAEAGIKTQTLLVGNAAEPSDIDPEAISLLNETCVCQALFENLTEVDEVTAKPLPAAAERWDISPDGMVYTFHLRPTGRWSDGTPVTAADFVYGIHRILSPHFAAFYSYMVWPIKNAEAFNEGKITDFDQVGIKALDPLTLQVTLERPTPYVLGMMAHSTWSPVPQHVIEKFGKMDEKGTRWTRPGNLVGNGPFVLKEWIQNGRIVVDKNPLYWDASHVRLNHIIFFPIENAGVEETDFRVGQLDVTYSLPTEMVDRYRDDHPEELEIEHTFGTFYLFCNVKRPPFDNVKLRQALDLCIDRAAISHNVLRDSVSPGFTFSPPDMVGYTCRYQVHVDVARARELLAEAGYPGGRGLPPIEMLSYAKASALNTLSAIQSEWARQLGVHVTILPQEFKTLMQNQQSGNYQIAFSGWLADYADPYTFLGMMVTGNGNNYAQWSNAEYDRLVDDSTRTGDNARRYEDFQKAEEIMLKSAPIIPLEYGERPYLKRTFVHGYPPARLAWHRWKNVWLER